MPFPLNKQYIHNILCFQFSCIFFSFCFSFDKCQMHTDDGINEHKILPTVLYRIAQRKNSEFEIFAHMICVPCDVSLSLPYMSFNKYCEMKRKKSCGYTVNVFFSLSIILFVVYPNSSAILRIERVYGEKSVLLQTKRRSACRILFIHIRWRQTQTLAH